MLIAQYSKKIYFFEKIKNQKNVVVSECYILMSCLLPMDFALPISMKPLFSELICQALLESLRCLYGSVLVVVVVVDMVADLGS